MNHQTPQPTPQPLCKVYEPLLPLLSQGQLTASEAAETRNHVVTCAWCQFQLRDYDFLRDALRRLDMHDDDNMRVGRDSAPPSYRPLTREDILQDIQEDFEDFEDFEEDSVHMPNQTSIADPKAQVAARRVRRFTALAGVAAVLLIVVLAAALFRGAAPRPAGPRISGAFTFVSLPSVASHPTSIVVGPDGNLWFTEAGAGTIGRMTVGGVVTEFPLPSNDARALPASIIIGPDGALWFAEVTADKIGRITTQGEITEFDPPYESHPQGIAFGPDGNLWFTSRAADEIGHMSPDGKLLGESGTPSSGSGPDTIVAGPDGNLWFTEQEAGKVGRITPQGVVHEFDSPIPVDNAIVAGPDGALWFISSRGGKIGRITPQGNVSLFPANRLDGALSGIAAGPDGNLWFALNAPAQSTEPSRIGRITPDGVIDFIQSPEPGVLSDLTFGADGSLWFTVNSPAKIGHLQLSH